MFLRVRWYSSMLCVWVPLPLCVLSWSVFNFSLFVSSVLLVTRFTSHSKWLYTHIYIFVRSHTLVPVCLPDFGIFSLGCTIKLNCCARLCCVCLAAYACDVRIISPGSSFFFVQQLKDNLPPPILHNTKDINLTQMQYQLINWTCWSVLAALFAAWQQLKRDFSNLNSIKFICVVQMEFTVFWIAIDVIRDQIHIETCTIFDEFKKWKQKLPEEN